MESKNHPGRLAMDSVTQIIGERTEIELRGRFGLSDLAARYAWLSFTDTQNTEKWKLYQQAGGQGKQASLRAAAGKLSGKPKVKAALAWLHLPRTEQDTLDREEHLERLRRHTTTSMGTYAEVEEINPDRGTLMAILCNDKLKDEEAFSACRRQLFAVRAKPWKDLPPEALQSVVAVKETKDGRVDIKLEQRVAAEQALARSHGWQSVQVQISQEAQTVAIAQFQRVLDDLREHDQLDAAVQVLESMKRISVKETA
jgi:hypothetical protein